MAISLITIPNARQFSAQRSSVCTPGATMFDMCKWRFLWPRATTTHACRHVLPPSPLNLRFLLHLCTGHTDDYKINE